MLRNSGIFQKEYIALVDGIIEKQLQVIREPIARKQSSIIERCVNNFGQPSITHYEVIEQLEINDTKISKVKCILETGRTHQIRVHMSYINHPLLGDDLYGGNTNLISRQALHSYKISFIHPITKQIVIYKAPLPNDLLTFEFC